VTGYQPRQKRIYFYGFEFIMAGAITKQQWAEDRLCTLRQDGRHLEKYAAEFFELSHQVGWPDASLCAVFQMGLDENTIRCSFPVCNFSLIELINLILYLNGSNIEIKEGKKKEFQSCPIPSENHVILPAHPSKISYGHKWESYNANLGTKLADPAIISVRSVLKSAGCPLKSAHVKSAKPKPIHITSAALGLAHVKPASAEPVHKMATQPEHLAEMAEMAAQPEPPARKAISPKSSSLVKAKSADPCKNESSSLVTAKSAVLCVDESSSLVKAKCAISCKNESSSLVTARSAPSQVSKSSLVAAVFPESSQVTAAFPESNQVSRSSQVAAVFPELSQVAAAFSELSQVSKWEKRKSSSLISYGHKWESYNANLGTKLADPAIISVRSALKSAGCPLKSAHVKSAKPKPIHIMSAARSLAHVKPASAEPVHKMATQPEHPAEMAAQPEPPARKAISPKSSSLVKAKSAVLCVDESSSLVKAKCAISCKNESSYLVTAKSAVPCANESSFLVTARSAVSESSQVAAVLP
ncbi:hypothetical protein M9458_033157, partial [Cirrhinus mrigala]